MEGDMEEHSEHVEHQENQARLHGCVTCGCGDEVGLLASYKCLYCSAWFCIACAEEHFGMTIAEYHGEDGEAG